MVVTFSINISNDILVDHHGSDDIAADYNKPKLS